MRMQVHNLSHHLDTNNVVFVFSVFPKCVLQAEVGDDESCIVHQEVQQQEHTGQTQRAGRSQKIVI